MPWNIILLPLLGGFLFLDWCYYTRLRHQRLDGNRLLIESAFAGAVFAILASAVIAGALGQPARVTAMVSGFWQILLLATIALSLAIGLPYYLKFPYPDHEHSLERWFKTIIAGGLLPFSGWTIVWICHFPATIQSFISSWKQAVPFQYSGTALAALMLGIFAALVFNFLSDYSGTAANVAEQAGDYILSLCFKAVRGEKAITFVLSNRMAYTGWVALSPNLKPESQIALILAARGCLDKDSSSIKWESKYLSEWIGDPRKAEEFIVSIPTRLIDHAHLATRELDRGSGLSLATQMPSSPRP